MKLDSVYSLESPLIRPQFLKNVIGCISELLVGSGVLAESLFVQGLEVGVVRKERSEVRCGEAAADGRVGDEICGGSRRGELKLRWLTSRFFFWYLFFYSSRVRRRGGDKPEVNGMTEVCGE